MMGALWETAEGDTTSGNARHVAKKPNALRPQNRARRRPLSDAQRPSVTSGSRCERKIQMLPGGPGC